MKNIDINSIQEIIDSYEYGQYKLLEEQIEIEYCTPEEILCISPFYQHNHRPQTGNCSELMSTGYKDILWKHPHYHVFRASGQDDTHFDKVTDNHCFLLISEIDILDNKWYEIEQKNIAKLPLDKTLLVDPSFKKIQPFSESNYSVTKLFNKGCNLMYSNNLRLKQGLFVPLGMDNETDLIGLGTNLQAEQKMSICLRRNGKKLYEHNIGSAELKAKQFQNKKIHECIDFLAEQKKEEIYFLPSEKKDVVIN